MKTLRKLKKNSKALSPVVASIILIAVTVAVSIAVAAWMGALTIGFMGTEEVRITNVAFSGGNTVVVTAKNTGSATVTIEEVYIAGALQTATLDPTTGAVAPNGMLSATFTYTYDPGTAYQIKLVSAKGNPFVYTATTPTAAPAA